MTGGLLMSDVAFFGRTLAEYLEMFAITLDELREGTTLDCPSGPDSFVAEACAAGCQVSGVDPMYTFEPDELMTAARDNLDVCFTQIDAQRDKLTFRDYDAFKRAKYEALEIFLRDDALHRSRMRTPSSVDCTLAGSSISTFIGRASMKSCVSRAMRSAWCLWVRSILLPVRTGTATPFGSTSKNSGGSRRWCRVPTRAVSPASTNRHTPTRRAGRI